MIWHLMCPMTSPPHHPPAPQEVVDLGELTSKIYTTYDHGVREDKIRAPHELNTVLEFAIAMEPTQEMSMTECGARSRT